MINTYKLLLFIFILISSPLSFGQYKSGGGSSSDSGTGSGPWKKNLTIGALGGWTYMNIFGQGSVPQYKGHFYGGEVEYRVGPDSFGFSPLVSYRRANLYNLGNSATQSEFFTQNIYTAGIKFSLRYGFLLFGWSWYDMENRATGTVTREMDAKAQGPELRAGLSMSPTPFLRIYSGAVVSHGSGNYVNSSSVSTREDYLSYSIIFGMTFLIPSNALFEEVKR